MNPEYAWWAKALEIGGGRQLTREQQQTLGITAEPQAGFYRKRNEAGQDIPVAIWLMPGGIVATVGDGIPVNPNDIWTWCCQWPVSEQVCRDVAENGKPWPDDPPALPKASNLPSDPHEALTVEFAGEREMAEAFLKTPITTQEQADKAAVWSKRIAAIAKKATDLHKVEKQPALDAGRAVDDKWRALKDEPDTLSKRLKRHLDDFLREQQRLEFERQRRAREEADRIRREAEEVARAAAPDDEAAKAEADRLQQQAADADREAEARNASAGRTGAKVALRTFVSAEITDYDALVMALKDRAEVRDVVQSLANRAAKSGIDLPGMKIIEEKRAA